jgi:hypothetical protein
MTEGNNYDPYAAQRSDSNLPIPDPTRLTTQLVDRALAAFREVMETRLAAMDRATKLVADDIERITRDRDRDLEHMQEDIDRATSAEHELVLSLIANVQDVSRERFDAIAIQFAERDTRTTQTIRESRAALDAALAAAKEAVNEQNKANSTAIGKSEEGTKERLDALGQLTSSSYQALDDKITELRSRMDRGEAAGEGRQVAHTEQQVASTFRRGDIGLALLAISILVSVIIAAITFAGKG